MSAPTGKWGSRQIKTSKDNKLLHSSEKAFDYNLVEGSECRQKGWKSKRFPTLLLLSQFTFWKKS